MFYIVIVHEASELDAVYFVQSENDSDILFMIKEHKENCEIIHIPEPVWKAMLYTDKLVYKIVR